MSNNTNEVKINDSSINPGKKAIIKVGEEYYRRICIKTHVITKKDSIIDISKEYVSPLLQEKDIVFITEKAVACTQNRAIPMHDIHPRPLAKFLCKFVLKTPYGIGLGIPETMECALVECGTLRILLATIVSAVGKLLGIRGWFYKVAGYKASSIDGPCSFTLPPYNNYVVLGPDKPDEVAAEISKNIGGATVAIVDINDLDGQILGISDETVDREFLRMALKDNPLGQCSEQTPMGIIRQVCL